QQPPPGVTPSQQGSFLPRCHPFTRGALGWSCPGAVSILTGTVCPHSAPDGLRGDTLRGIGCGPTIHQLLHACKHCQEIITSDYTEQNCWELEEGLKNEAGLKGDREKWAEKQEKLRKQVGVSSTPRVSVEWRQTLHGSPCSWLLPRAVWCFLPMEGTPGGHKCLAVCLRLTLLLCFPCRYERVPDGMATPGFPSSLQRQAVVRAHSLGHSWWEYTAGVLKWHCQKD
uniref:Uncharacterized protein n=1 Tax=Serinus canaria TaxID=9135 RepID=A0A8C9NYR9_SERCA